MSSRIENRRAFSCVIGCGHSRPHPKVLLTQDDQAMVKNGKVCEPTQLLQYSWHLIEQCFSSFILHINYLGIPIHLVQDGA